MSVTRPTELDPLVDEFRHLSQKSRPGEALQMLRKVASMVKPIMRQRNWRVGVLTEFYPAEANLLGENVNRGEIVRLRLRYAGDDTQFMPLENVVDTMLHELAHNVHGPHDQQFNALWDKLRDEHESLIRKGYTGEGFLGTGNRLGGRRVPTTEVKRQARAAADAAERRRALNRGSGQKLGGQGILRGQNAREIIAAAAERRTRIERGCATGDRGRETAARDPAAAKFTTTKAEQEDAMDAAVMQAYIDMIQEEESQIFGEGYVPPSQENPAGVRGQGATVPPTTTTTPKTIDLDALRRQQMEIERQLRQPERGSTTTTTTTTSSKPDREPVVPPETWTCDICTLVNPMQHLMCGACETERPAWYSEAPPVPTHSKPKSMTKPNAARSTLPALQPRLSAADALARIESQASARAQAKPVGWMCSACGNWTESEWWTCSACGRMKTSS
jgi:hypothetical protein